MRIVYAVLAVAASALIAYVLVTRDVATEHMDEVDTGGEVAVEPAAGGAPAASSGDVPFPRIGLLALDELPFEGACGLFLSPVDDDRYVFVDAVTEPAPSQDEDPVVMAAMRIDDDLVALRRVRFDGEPVGDTYPRQVFESPDAATVVVVRVRLVGQSVPSGELTVMKSGRSTAKLPVDGRAGC